MIYRNSHQFLSDLVAWIFADGSAPMMATPSLAEVPDSTKAERPRLNQDELSKMFAAELYGRAA